VCANQVRGAVHGFLSDGTDQRLYTSAVIAIDA
jgi:hypothetical protein